MYFTQRKPYTPIHRKEVKMALAKKVINNIKEEESSPKKAAKIAAAVAIAPALAVEKAVNAAADVVKEVAVKTEENNTKAQLKKYNPVFPEDYSSETFSLPNMIMIVDDAVRKNIKVCEGSIGWKSNANTLEVFHLYDEAIDMSGLTFYPSAVCDSVYYVDPHNRKSFINIDYIYEKLQNQKLGELTNLAYDLGAKAYSIEVVEEISEAKNKSFKVAQEAKVKAGLAEKNTEKKTKKNGTEKEVDIVNGEISVEANHGSVGESRRTYNANVRFSESRIPVVPELCWFKNDESILSLIKQVCSGTNTMEVCEFDFDCSKIASIQSNVAAKIDLTVKKIGGSSSVNIKKKSESEYASKIFLRLEF